jgi:ferredoxin
MTPSTSNVREGVAGPAVILCDCVMATPEQGALIAEAGGRIRDLGLRALRVRDLCGAVARREQALIELASDHPLLVLACRPRAVHWLLHAAGVDVRTQSINVIDLRQDSVSARAALAGAGLAGGNGKADLPAAPDDWIPWFPVLDYDRCQHCGQCASFCVFGVYSKRPDGRVAVTNPRGCKTNCPACARICPSAAIMFPKHNEAPFDGSAISDEESVRARTRQYTLQLLGDDPYAALAARRERVELLRRSAGRES